MIPVNSWNTPENTALLTLVTSMEARTTEQIGFGTYCDKKSFVNINDFSQCYSTVVVR